LAVTLVTQPRSSTAQVSVAGWHVIARQNARASKGNAQMASATMVAM